MHKKPDIREKVLKNGLEFATNKELIMLLLGNGTKENPIEKLAGKVIDKIHKQKNNLIEDLQKIEGIGPSKAIIIGAAIEFGRRQNAHREKQILQPSDIIPYIQHYAIQKQEHFICITLNGAHEIIEIHPVSIGTINETMVHPREVFSNAIKDRATAIIICHNHPSENCNPSNNDIKTTKRLLEASNFLGIQLLDHIILTTRGYFSFLENNMLLGS